MVDAHADSRTRILDAAEAIVQARGVPALTLESAARDAGISKGGLLYHYASKEALLAAMLGRLAEVMEADFAATLAAQPEGRGRAARALLASALKEPVAACVLQDRAAAVFLAAFHHDPALLDPVRAVFARMRAAIAADGLPPGVGQAIMCATDGLFMVHVFGLYTLTPAELADLRAALERLLETGR
ncbi:TetR/AcrR family transcriptional regulator [Falsiroseomonas selenitidurans]|uniref:TetR/AcrR family transcriptional regulator n=1 Tax=Falsiroseomonas selenitidurans TaxID=2716335 RepID=A0ABX1E4L2_9PROT|nr:TetR/AcrR family transcriptional regulator [Falsiroseomonas selenitidurans]NKC31723.1 TetR/AcrR family transcriptional regulator [Falsiroseomonas selenitidurans]